MKLEPQQFLCISLSLLVLFIVSLVLNAVSYSVVQIRHAGLDYNSITKSISMHPSGHPYESGRYLVGLSHKFVQYPTYFLNAEFLGENSLYAWSAEGQNMQMEISFQYQLDRIHLLELFKRHEGEYQNVMRFIVEEALKEVSTKYVTADFFDKRREIRESMFKEAQVVLRDNFAILKHFQVRDITIPENFDNKVTTKVTVQQQIITAEQQQLADVIRAEAQVIISEAQTNAKITELEARTYGDIQISNATNSGRFLIVQAENLAYSNLSSALNLTATELANYMWISKVSERVQDGAKIYSSITSPLLQV